MNKSNQNKGLYYKEKSTPKLVILEKRSKVNNMNNDIDDRILVNRAFLPSKREVPRGVQNSKVWRQDKFRRDWSRH